MNLKILVLFLTLFGFFCHAEIFQPHYTRDCTGHNVIPQSSVQAFDSPETNAVTETTGIRFLELTARTTVDAENSTFEPAVDAQKAVFAKRLTKFLKIFPVELLRKNSDTCFIFVKRFRIAAALTFDNIILLTPDDDTFNKLIAHEFLHAVDNMHNFEMNIARWNEINRIDGCIYNSGGSHRMLKPGFPDIDRCSVSPKGKTDLYEDRAEIFAGMILNYDLLMAKIKSGSALESKILVLKKFMQLFTPEMGENYWHNHSSTHSSWN